MRLLIIVPGDAGTIRQAEVHDVQNEATWETDGGLLLEDGRVHVYPASTRLFDLSVLTRHDVLTWGRDGKYALGETGDLCLVDGWAPLVPEPEV